ncbi:hypothetical protein N7539_008534 [Penicillium diatomitis]|uniref:Protein kinase domain-containing protein n=1 Tax=Penicillium diatomitis TaxID=2819901 RepID=A0A9X0BLQ9_9EURO|nr:uncharacterized protein N7539_008534 [Penicillium diatomitis]KAJ5471965.1 hypothetical protein N7539_008534 [Penicillium diatomitis]
MTSEIEKLRQQLADAERLLSASEQQLSASQQRLSKTNLPTFLDGLHKHLFLGLEVQPDETQSTRGDPANTANKLRPRYLRAWDTFSSEQEEVWRLLMDSSLVEDKLFTSLHTLEEMGENIRRQLIGSELDLNHFLRQTVEDHVSKIVEQLYKDPVLRQTFGLRGTIRFENHSNTLSPDHELVEGLRSVDIRGRPTRRRSPRLAERQKSASDAATREPRTPLPARTKRPRADQFCVYNIPNQFSESTHRVAAYIKEYKSPLKVTLGHIYEGLGDMDVDEVVQEKDDEPSKLRFQRALIGLLSQPFDYMIRGLTQVGVFSTGEVDIYLKIGDDPSTLFYHLSVPKGDVGYETGWDPHSDRPNRLHLTAVGQALAFTLQALKLRPRSQAWGLEATNALPKWAIVPADILDDIPEHEVPSSEYRPPKAVNFLRSPIQLRRRGNRSKDHCQSLRARSKSDDEEDDAPTPSRKTRASRNIEGRRPTAAGKAIPTSEPSSLSKENHRRYCTLKCLRGLVHGGQLDLACPNVRDHSHGPTGHVINSDSFVRKLQQQLSETVNAGCEALGVHGSRGALLKVTLLSHGYTVPAKCTVAEFRNHLRHEAAVYRKLESIQGVHIPIYLGSIDMAHPFSYDGIAYLDHMMLLSPSGQSPDLALRELGRTCLISKMTESLSAIHNRDVVHKDPAPRNWSYNSEVKKVVFFDFERAEIIEARPVLGMISPNRKRKRIGLGSLDKKHSVSEFAEEINKAVHEMRCFRVPHARRD